MSASRSHGGYASPSLIFCLRGPGPSTNRREIADNCPLVRVRPFSGALLRRLTPYKSEGGGQSEPNEPIRPRRILLIEENDDARSSLRLLLEGSGHEVYEAVDGLAGVKEALELKPDVILIDLGLPGLDGYEVAARIRSASSCSTTRLTALTGYAQGEYRTRAQIAGFQDYLVKPVDAGMLEKVIAAFPVQLNMSLEKVARAT